MSISSFEILPNDILYEIFYYLSPIDVLRSFLSLNKRFSNLLRNEHLWYIHIGDSTMSLMTFNEDCQNVLKLIGNRVISLRLTLINTIGGWSLISSSLGYHQTILLRRLHLIDIKPHEFDKLLCNHFIKQLDTLLVDVEPSNPFNSLEVEGAYLVKVCSRMPHLRICRLPFSLKPNYINQIETYSLKSSMILPSLLNTNHLRNLTIGIHTSRFLERLLLCIPLIENLSFGIRDENINKNDRNILPTSIDAHLVQHLSRLHINCLNMISFHRIISLLSSLFNQLCHLSLKLEAHTYVCGSMMISGDIIQQLCIDRLKPMATYSLDLLFYVKNDSKEKIIFNSFCQVEFIQREKPRVVLRECYESDISPDTHCFIVFTLPYNDTTLFSYMFSNGFKKSCQISTGATNLFPRVNKFTLYGDKKTNGIRDLVKLGSSISSFPWSFLKEIEIHDSDVITQHTLKSLLEIAYNVHTLYINDPRGILTRTIFHNKDNYGTRINRQIKSLEIRSESWRSHSVERFCILLSNQFSNLKTFSFIIYGSYNDWVSKQSRMKDGKNKSTKRIVNLIYLLVDHLQQLVSLRIFFSNMFGSDTPYFPDLVRRELHQYPLSRPCRSRCSTEGVQIWL